MTPFKSHSLLITIYNRQHVPTKLPTDKKKNLYSSELYFTQTQQSDLQWYLINEKKPPQT